MNTMLDRKVLKSKSSYPVCGVALFAFSAVHCTHREVEVMFDWTGLPGE